MSKFSKNVCPIPVTCLVGQASHMPQSRACTEGFRDSLAGHSPSREKDLEFLKKICVSRFLVTQFGDFFASGSSSREVTQKVSQLPSRLPREWTF